MNGTYGFRDFIRDELRHTTPLRLVLTVAGETLVLLALIGAMVAALVVLSLAPLPW